ncbi:uncharacterized protein [Pyxicephalus adspersus]|uniref:uncharacterized protein n=1 Tax=Pyxicephalus adspersus TaxID=30357 RepID=UPI003B59AA28
MICITPGSLHVLWRRSLGILGLEMNADVRSGLGKTRTEDQKSPEHSISMKSSSESSSHPIDLTNKPILKQEIFPGARCQCDEDPRSIPATDSFTKANHELSSYHIKEEPQSKVKEHHLLDVSHTNLADHRAHMLSCIKEEPSLPYTDIKVELFSDNPEIKPERLLHNKICDPPAHVLCHLTEIKEEPQSPDVDSPRDISTPADHIPSVRIKEEEDFPDAGIHILKGTITDSDVHSFTITGEYIKGIEIKLTTPLGDSPLSSKTTYSCPVCKRTFSNHGNLARHRETHKGKKMSCSECGADFCNKLDLMAHARFHKASRVLHCSECNITFRSNSHLIIHKRIHTGEKPFACPQCGKRFYSKSNVAGHMKVHTGSKQYCCSTCGKSYARKENLYSHQRIHQEAPTFTCAHCGQCFVDEHKFTRHQRFHTLEKPYPCILCGKRFAHKARLLRHERTHAGENLVCSDCDFYENNNVRAESYEHQVDELVADNKDVSRSSDFTSDVSTIDTTTTVYTTTDCRDDCIKIEPISGEGDEELQFQLHGNICGDHIHTDPTFTVNDIKQEASSYEGDATCSDICTTMGHTQKESTDIRGEHSLKGEENNNSILKPMNQTQSKSTDVKGEPHYEEPIIREEETVNLPESKHTYSDIKEEPHPLEDIKHSANDNIGFSYTGEHLGKLQNSEECSTSNKFTEIPKTLYTCHVCQRTFRNHWNLVKHREAHKGKKPTCSICWDQFLSKSELLLHQRQAHKIEHIKTKKSSCSKCGATFYSKSDLLEHRKMHKTNRYFHCSQCEKKFTSNSQLVIHQRIHTGEKPFACSKCGRRFPTKSNLNKHIKLHTRDKQFPCLQCGESFSKKENLNIHKLVHTTNNRFSCSICGWTFSDHDKFMKHQQFHKSNKPYPCLICGKGFCLNSLLLLHMRSHTDVNLRSCSECGMVFIWKKDLVRHQKSHLGEKPFQCGECKKGFTTEKGFTYHKRVHSTEKSFACSDCDKTFKHKGQLTAHQRTHVGENAKQLS